MARKTIDVVGIGNAIVDVIAQVDERFLEANAMAKGGMALVDEAQSATIYDAMGPGVENSGGSAANTVAGIASLGGASAFIGKVKNDVLGRIFTHDLRSIGVDFQSPAAEDGPATASCLICVTPDAQRTMSTFLGACINLRPEDIDKQLIQSASITYLEGYLFDPPLAKQAFREAAATAAAAGRSIALTLSDTFCVARHRDDFLAFIEQDVDILFANEDELRELFPSASLEESIREVAKVVKVAAVTCSERGSLVVDGTQVHEVPAVPVSRLVDTTGAGDLYAAGFLLGTARGLPLDICGRLGAIAAAEVISHIGARPQAKLSDLAAADPALASHAESLFGRSQHAESRAK